MVLQEIGISCGSTSYWGGQGGGAGGGSINLFCDPDKIKNYGSCSTTGGAHLGGNGTFTISELH